MKRIAAFGMFAALALGAYAQTDPAAVDRLATMGKAQNRAFKTLSHFTNKFGPRLTGSPNLAAAQEWAVTEFKKYGLQNVHMEQWGEVPVGFYRGKNQTVRVTSPWKRDIVFTTPAWTAGTNGKVSVVPIMEPATVAELEALKPKLKDTWMLMRRPSGLRGPAGQPSEVEKALEGLEVGCKIYAAADERVHTGGRFTGLTMENLPKGITLRVRKSDYDEMKLALTVGRELKIEANIENHFVKGPVPQYNVIADIPGTEKPDEMVIICGHFDSWNGPGSVGANDNGTGSSVTLESARLLMQAGIKPKRTIRFILWSGEEQGLLGSRAYVEKHKAEMGKVSAVLNDDGGTNYQGGYNCLESMAPMLREAIAPTQKAFPELTMAVNVSATMPRGGSSDHAPFVWAGVPGFFSIESGKADYGFVWHTQNDTPQFSVAEYLAQSSTNAALVSYYLANHPQLLARVPIEATAGTGGLPVGGAVHYYDPTFREHLHKPGECDHMDDYEDYSLDVVLRFLGILK